MLTQPILIPQLAGTKRKRPQKSKSKAKAEDDELEDVRPFRQAGDPPPAELPEKSLQKEREAEAGEQELPPSKDALSEKNLRLFTEMDAAANYARPGSIKRSSSQQSLSQRSIAASDGTQGTNGSSTNAHYRFELLRPSQLHIHAEAPPKDIQDAIDAIVKAPTPEGRREQLEPIIQKFQASCTEMARASVGENDFVKILHDAIDSMGFKHLCLRTNADWQEQLKPRIQRSPFNVGVLRSKAGCEPQQHRVDESSAPPPAKHQQQQTASRPYISPQPSMADGSISSPAKAKPESNEMPPPATVPAKEGTIKTPRPNISIGISLRALTSALSSQDLNQVVAELFLKDLQQGTESREPGGPEEAMLISVPAPRASDLVFPFAVLEGKAYLTGKQLSEAENQAAVSGACALKMQLRLDELVRRTAARTLDGPRPEPSTDPDPDSTRSLDRPAALPHHSIPLFFSVCTEGPMHLLFVHWTEVRHGRRQFHMRLLKCVHGVMPVDELADFFVKLDHVLRWGSGRFLESLVARLGRLAKNMQAQA